MKNWLSLSKQLISLSYWSKKEEERKKKIRYLTHHWRTRNVLTHKGELPGLWILWFMIFAALHPALLGQIKHMTYLEVMWLLSCQRLTRQKDQPEDKCSDSILLHDPLSTGYRVCLEENSEGTNNKEKKSLWDIRTYGMGTTCPSKTQVWRLTCKASASSLSHFKASVVKIFSSLSSSKTELGGIKSAHLLYEENADGSTCQIQPRDFLSQQH